MPTLPGHYSSLIQVFAPHFSRTIWAHVKVLLGAILAPGRRTVTAVLRLLRQRQRAIGMVGLGLGHCPECHCFGQ